MNKSNLFELICIDNKDEDKIYESGMILYNNDMSFIKIADGIHKYSQLPYIATVDKTPRYVTRYFGYYLYDHSIHIKKSKIDNTIYENGTIVAIEPDEPFNPDNELELCLVKFKLANGKDTIENCPTIADSEIKEIN